MTRPRSLVIPLVITLAVGLVVVALVMPRMAAETLRDGASDTGADPGMEHIHGIGIDPGDGAIYAGTHHGLFRISDGRATRVADRVQDYMGFTVAGPGQFLASGHPGPGQDGPSSVGLIESTDAGQTWQALSLSGEADFHALEYRHDRVYGLNSMTGQLLVTTSKQTWQELSTAQIADFAVSPSDADVLVATTEQGVTRSTDGGATFEPLESAPVMVFVSWAEDGTLAGVAPDGTVFTAQDPATEWTARARLDGQPEALTIDSAARIYAATSGEVLASTDGGETFSPLLDQ